MAGWSILSNGSGLDCVEIIRTLQSCSRRCFGVDHAVKGSLDGCDDYKDELRCLFDQVLSVFLKEIASKGSVRPIPAMLGDGRCLDLFKLFWVVRERGGYEWVSKNRLWALVAEELGLDVGVKSCIKLVYRKYLDELDEWLRKLFRDESLGIGQSGRGGNLGFSEFRGLLLDGQDQRKNNDMLLLKNCKYVDLDVEKSDTTSVYKMHDGAEKSSNDDDEKFYDDDDNDDVVLQASVANKDFSSRKRKRESLSGMLNWVIEVAKHPNDPTIGVRPEGSKCKEHESKEFWDQALLAREVLLLQRHIDSNAEQSLLQKKLKMHPSMYEDNKVFNQQSTERLRCSKRLPSLTKSHFCPCCEPCSTTQSKLASPCTIELENVPKEEVVVTVDLLAPSTTVGMPGDDPFEKHVSVGPLFQAEVPEWTGVVSESDTKWLGTRVWPMDNGKLNSHIELDPIGKGRQDSCDCQLPGSVQCVRFHIAEKRMKMKLELGLVFYHWKFDHMGEEVSLRWTIEEEKRFKNMVKLNPPSLNKCFWDDAFKYFPRKARENLVSYFFNVFLVQRRSYQNRVTPKNIDSDDDESGFGSFSESFGHEAVKFSGSKFHICTQNKQCTELE
ncbi:hypothetical protein L1049_007154 [Liquidambar formosana]|uniref:ARID domain-containing protein n=1 Tax=Liquidambar formosana TaxID=63359 RepID=A0AAP0RIA1_LIQFO